MFGIRDAKVRERLLRENNLTLKKTDDLCHTAESTSTQMKAVETDNAAASSVAAVGSARRKSGKVAHRKDNERKQECKYCGKTHDFTLKELCPAFGKSCKKCGKSNHFAVKCKQARKTSPSTVRKVEIAESDENAGIHG